MRWNWSRAEAARGTWRVPSESVAWRIASANVNPGMTSSWNSKSLTGMKFGLLANFAGTGASAVAQLACIPLYVKFLGIEGYGLIGFYLMLQTLLQVLDLGLSPTVNREMARYSVKPEKAAEARDLVRTLEFGYWLIGLVLGATLLAAASWIAAHWIKSSVLPVSSITRAVMLMGILAVFQWPISFYQGALMGLHRQVLFNILKVIAVTFSNGGAVLILWLVSPTIEAFLVWQISISAAQVVLIAFFLWSSLPRSERPPRFNPSIIRSVWRFAAGMSGITLIGLILTQVDKVLVSKLLTLKVFGYYSLAWTVANGLLIISSAVFNVIFPRMSAQVAASDENGICQSYHRGAQLMAVLVLPLAAVLSFFSFDILRLWTGSTETAAFDAPILTVLVVGSALNALLYLPYALQLAFGWTKLSFVAGLLSVAILIPLLFPITKYFGAVGAASMWAALNTLNMLVVVPVMHRRLLRGEAWRYFGDIGLPLISTVGIAVLGRLVIADLTSPVVMFACVSSVWLGCLVAAILAAPHIRSWALTQLMNVKVQMTRYGSVG
jgi:O-antigen/teichoic acid export membrane protein